MVSIKELVNKLPKNTYEFLNEDANAQNNISEVMVMASPDIGDWIVPKELILTSFFGLDIEQQKQLIVSLSRFNASGIIVKQNMYLSEIPSEIVNLCQKVNLPMIKVHDLKFRDIIDTFFKLKNNQFNSSIHLINPQWERVMQKMLNDKLSDNENLWLNHQMKSDEDTKFILVTTIQSPSSTKTKTLINLIKNIQIQFLIGFVDGEIYILIQSHNLDDFENFMHSNLMEMGLIYSETAKITQIHHTYWKLNNIRKLALIEHKNESIINYGSMGVEKLFVSVPTDQLSSTLLTDKFEQFSNDNPDLLKSLTYYLQSKLNITKAAKKLFIHPKSLSYRLRKIEKMLNVDLNSHETILSLDLSTRFINLKNKGFYVNS